MSVCKKCGKKNNSFWGESLNLANNEFLCYKCASPISNMVDNLYLKRSVAEFEELKDSIIAKSTEMFDDDIITLIVKKIEGIRKYVGVETLEEQKKSIEEEKQKKLDLENIMLTTGSMFEGYRVEKYIDVICEEIVFKNDLISTLDASAEALLSVFSFKEKELSSTSNLISKARIYVKDKFKKKAVDVGANAVLGIEFESSFGNEIVRVSMAGTAVRIVKENQSDK